MIEPTTFWLYVIGAFFLVASPGPDFFYVISRGMAQGRKAGLLSAVGIACGLLVHTTLAALGLTMLLKTSVMAFLLVKYIGAVYLLYLGIKMLKSKTIFEADAQASIDSKTIVRQAMLTNLFNPKAALTFAAFLPQFADPQRGYFAWQMALLGLTLCGIAFAWFSLIGYFAGSAGAWFLSKPRLANGVRYATGSILIGLSCRLALQRG